MENSSEAPEFVQISAITGGSHPLVFGLDRKGRVWIVHPLASDDANWRAIEIKAHIGGTK